MFYIFKRTKYVYVLCGLLSALLCSSALATPSGLNNIPTADVVPQKVFVLQAFMDIGKDNKPEYFTGFKCSPMENLEIGLDGRIFPESTLEETITFQGKYRLKLLDQVGLAIGVSNVGDHAKSGWENPYAVISYDADLFRAHFGGTLQRDNEGFFTGLDKTIAIYQRDLTLRADIIQTNDAHDVTYSAGFIYDLGHNLLIESWISFPVEPALAP